MPVIPIFEVYDAWEGINDYCEELNSLTEDSLIFIAKKNLEKFNWAKRDVDFGEPMLEFPSDSFEYDKKRLNIILDKIKVICSFCEGYHNESCYNSNARKAIEISLFGKYFPLKMNTFGEYLINLELITKEQIQEAYIIQKMTNSYLGSIAIIMDKLKPDQVIKILNLQKSIPKQFGDIAIDSGLLSVEEVNKIIYFQKKTHLFIGDILVSLGYISKKDKDFHLKKYKITLQPQP